MTLPTTPRGSAKMLPGRGVKIHYLYYWSSLFNNPESEGKQVPIRYDPFNIGVAFAFINGQWVQCHSEYYAVFSGHTERELMFATQELRRQRRKHMSQRNLSAKTIGDFLQSVEAQELLLAQRLHDQQTARICQESENFSSAPADSETPPRTFLVAPALSGEIRTMEEAYETYEAF